MQSIIEIKDRFDVSVEKKEITSQEIIKTKTLVFLTLPLFDQPMVLQVEDQSIPLPPNQPQVAVEVDHPDNFIVSIGPYSQCFPGAPGAIHADIRSS